MMRNYILAAAVSVALPLSARAQEAPDPVTGVCDLSVAAQAVYAGNCIFTQQAEAAGSKAILVQLDNGLNVRFLRPSGSTQWTVETAQGTLPVAIDPQPGEVAYEWEGATLVAKAAADADAAATSAPSEEAPAPGQGASAPSGGQSIPGTGISIPGTTKDSLTNTAVDLVKKRATDVLLKQLFGL